MSQIEKVEKISSANSQIRLSETIARLTEAYNDSTIDLSTATTKKTFEAQEENKLTEKSKRNQAFPSGLAALANVISTVYFAQKNPQIISAASQITSQSADALKKPYEANEVSSSGAEQYSRIAADKIKEMLATTAKQISEMCSMVTNINSKTGGL